MNSKAPSTRRLLERLSPSRRAALIADVRRQLPRDAEEVRGLLDDVQKDLARLKSTLQHAPSTVIVTDIQVKIRQLHPHFLNLLADHRAAQVLDVLPDPHPSVGSVVVDALDLDLYLGADLLATVAGSDVSTDDWESMIETISLFENAVQRALTYVGSIGAASAAE